MGAVVVEVLTPEPEHCRGLARLQARAEGAKEPALHPAVGSALLSSARAVAVALKIRTIDY